MNRNCQSLLIILMIMLIFGQIVFINNSEKKKINKECIAQQNIEKHKTLEEFSSDLNCLKDKNIISANKVDKNWCIKVKIQGNKDDLLNELSKLNNYDVKSFIINKNKDEKSIILELNGK